MVFYEAHQTSQTMTNRVLFSLPIPTAVVGPTDASNTRTHVERPGDGSM